MKILFVINTAFFSEPLGVMSISAICKKHGHTTRLAVLKRHNLLQMLREFQPDVIGYSVMTSDMAAFAKADSTVTQWITESGRRALRVMGGPHPTFFPQALEELDLDAIIVGEGDYASIRLIDAFQAGEDLSGIPNVIPRGGSLETMERELIPDLDDLPFLDREIFYDAAPHCKHFQLRSVKTARGCPYRCSYCFNHAFNDMFRSSGKILRRRSVDSIIQELKHVIETTGPVTMIRFGDDTFAYKVDDWLVELLTRYKNEIGLPYYCLMRSNVLTEEMAKLLAESGCRSIGMSLETGNEEMRNDLLSRNISDGTALRSFELARKYKMHTQANSMLALPGSDFEDDYNTFMFAKRARSSVPTFSIWCPFPGTRLTQRAVDMGLITDCYDYKKYYYDKTPIDTYSEEEKDMHVTITQIGCLFCKLPDSFLPLFSKLIKMQPNRGFALLGTAYTAFEYYTKMFFWAVPKNPIRMAKLFIESMRYQLSKPAE
ncbi:B12-binding domain-containing radical SAM protein [Pseudodesulfovibrio sp.]|nr:B12-binding domain-containing radical SAM protein [Pseudodesulfovibrio sp.]